MVLAMADETRETLLNRVKEQGEIVRQLKAAKADATQVRDMTIFPPRLDVSSRDKRVRASFLSLSTIPSIIANRFPPSLASVKLCRGYVRCRCTRNNTFHESCDLSLIGKRFYLFTVLINSWLTLALRIVVGYFSFAL